MVDAMNSPVLSTTLTVAVSLNTLFNLALGMVVARFKSYASTVSRLEDKIERAEADRDAKVKGAEKDRDAKQHELTEKLIDARMRDFTHQLGNVMQKLQTTSDAQEAFVKDAERKMERLGEKDHEAELKVLREIKEVQLEMAKQGATKEDLRRHEDAMRKELNDVRAQARH